MFIAIVGTVGMLAIGWLVWRGLQSQEARDDTDRSGDAH